MMKGRLWKPNNAITAVNIPTIAMPIPRGVQSLKVMPLISLFRDNLAEKTSRQVSRAETSSERNIEPYTNERGQNAGAIMLQKKKPGGESDHRAN
jgi:hypothetical protein